MKNNELRPGFRWFFRRTESNADNYAASVSGFISEIDRMQLEVREYLTIHPGEIAVH